MSSSHSELDSAMTHAIVPDPWVHLVPSGTPEDEDLDDIKFWLRSQKKREGFFEKHDFDIDVLREALSCAHSEIEDKLEAELAKWVDEAQNAENRIDADDLAFYEDRKIDWSELDPSSFSGFDKQKVIDHLHEARDEIAYLMEEVRRLRMYVGTERLKTERDITKTQGFRPLERRK